MRTFTDTEQAILKLVQGNLPDSATPFSDIAEQVGVETRDVLELLQGLKQDGAIRRFGATLRHQKAGYGFNAMVAWRIDSEEEVLRVGEQLAEEEMISHCYYRKEQPGWPYNLYTMVHGKSRDHCVDGINALARKTGLEDFQILFSRKELKKTSMRYF